MSISSSHKKCFQLVTFSTLVLLQAQLCLIRECESLHLHGTWDPDKDFFLFLSKFGFQKTDPANKNNTQGFIFGNITYLNARHDVFITVPVSSLTPKVRVPRGTNVISLNVNANNANQTHSDNDNGTTSGGHFKKVLSEKQNTTGSNVTNHATGAAVSSNNASSFAATHPLNVKVVSETFVQPSKSSPIQTPTHVNFSNGGASSSKNDSKLVKSTVPTVNKSSSTIATATISKPPSKKLVTSTSPSIKPNNSSVKQNLATATISQFYPATLVVLDRGFFIEFYKYRLDKDKDKVCKHMFERISHVEHDSNCFPSGTERFLRRVPCAKGQLCPDDNGPSNQSNVVAGHQFTYAISDLSKPKFWYVSLVPCYRNPLTCEWEYTKNNTPINYDIYLVNGNPYTKNQNPLEYQFSFDRQDAVEIYLVFFLCYLILVPLQVHAVLRQRHIVPKLFTTSVALELTAVTSNVVHVLKFAVNGEGHPTLAVFGDITDIIARAIFMLILLLLAKGWAITRTELTSKPFIFSIWSVYGIVHILLYVWKQTEVDVIEDIDEYETWPGWFILGLRTLIMVWFLYELKDTMDHEHQPHKLNFFLHFGAAALVWFIYLPVVALIALQVTPLWRSKFLLGITYAADCLAFAIMTHLLWPTRTEQYFLLMSKDAILSLTDELEEFNEAPHVVNSYVRRPQNQWYPVNYSFQSVSSSEARSFNQGNGNTIQTLNQRFSNGSNVFVSDDVKDNVPLITT